MPERDADAERGAINDLWDEAAAGWGRQEAVWGRQFAPVSEWMVEALELTPGQRVLELAAGPGDVGFRALPSIMPGGTLISSDQSDKMVDVAHERARRLGLEGVEFRVLDGEWIDLELASVDAVLCRWGYMLMVDPAAALRETRRVLRSGGRLSLACWDEREANPWALIPNAVLVEQGLGSPPEPGAPGPFALSDRGLLRSLIEDAGFTEVRLDAVEVVRSAPDFPSWWEAQLDLSVATREAIDRAGPERAQAVADEVAARFAPYTAQNGELAVPGRTLVAVAEA